MSSSNIHEACTLSLHYGDTSFSQTWILPQCDELKDVIVPHFYQLVANIDSWKEHIDQQTVAERTRNAKEDNVEVHRMHKLHDGGDKSGILRLKLQSNDTFSMSSLALNTSKKVYSSVDDFEGSNYNPQNEKEKQKKRRAHGETQLENDESTIICTKAGSGWPKKEIGKSIVIVNDQNDNNDSAIFVKDYSIQPTNLLSGLTGTIKHFASSVKHPVIGVKNLITQPFVEAKNSSKGNNNNDNNNSKNNGIMTDGDDDGKYMDNENENKSKNGENVRVGKKGNVTDIGKSALKGIGKGLQSVLVEAPLNITKDILMGSSKLVDGVINTPHAAYNRVISKKIFNPWIGYTKRYKISDLNDELPGNIGDFLCIDKGWYSHIMLKFDKQNVIHRYGTAEFDSNNKMTFVQAKAQVMFTHLNELKKDYPNGSITVASAPYCIVREEIKDSKKNKKKHDFEDGGSQIFESKKYIIYKSRSEKEIVKLCTSLLNDNKNGIGWNPISKNCEHLCFQIKYDLNLSPQIERMKV